MITLHRVIKLPQFLQNPIDPFLLEQLAQSLLRRLALIVVHFLRARRYYGFCGNDTIAAWFHLEANAVAMISHCLTVVIVSKMPG